MLFKSCMRAIRKHAGKNSNTGKFKRQFLVSLYFFEFYSVPELININSLVYVPVKIFMGVGILHV